MSKNFERELDCFLSLKVMFKVLGGTANLFCVPNASKSRMVCWGKDFRIMPGRGSIPEAIIPVTKKRPPFGYM